MQGRYAVLGWGSLIWDLDDLAPRVDLPWHMEAGPRLPMEFSRVSPKRKMGLAVCLDDRHGQACATHAIPSRRDALADVIADLAARERTQPGMIGGVCLASGSAQGRAAIVQAVCQWCEGAGWLGAVWTDLHSNFDDHLSQPFSVQAAMAYLRTLAGENLDEAVRYIHHAPAATDTPLRRALAADPWWQEQATRLAPLV